MQKILILLLGCLAGCAAPAPSPPTEVALPPGMPGLEPERVAGDWYVLARLTGEADDEVGSRLQLTPQAQGFALVAHGFARDFGQPQPPRTGTIRLGREPAQWSIDFPWARAQVWIVWQVDAGYRHALLGDVTREHAWILGRERYLTDERYQELAARLAAEGYPVGRLRKVPQSAEYLGAPGFLEPDR